MLAACRRRDELYARWLRGRGWTLTRPEAFGHEDCIHDPDSVNGQPICLFNGIDEEEPAKKKLGQVVPDKARRAQSADPAIREQAVQAIRTGRR